MSPSDQHSTSAPLVSLVMPVKNEGAFLTRALEAICSQNIGTGNLEVIIVDGGSTDGSIEALRNSPPPGLALRFAGGPGVNCPAAMNIGIGLAAGALIAKVDGHGHMSSAFISTAVDYLRTHPGVGCVGGPVLPTWSTRTGQANALARFSRFGVGGGVYTVAPELAETDSVQCGVYRRDALLEVGGFDPDLQWGEDEELNYRLRQAGWSIVLHPGMQFNYEIRPTVGSLFRQYIGYGMARVAVVRKHPAFLRARHLAPGLLVGGLAASLAIGLAVPPIRPVTALIWAAYLAFVATGAAVIALRARFGGPQRIAASLAAIHLGYGIGLFRGLLATPRASNPPDRPEQ